MKERQTKMTASIGLIIGAILGTAGSFVPSASLRGLAWGIDGIALIIAGALLTIYYYRTGVDGVAAGFLIFTIGQGFILSTPGVNLDENIALFGAGTGLWSASLVVISLHKIFPIVVRVLGLIASVLFAVTAVMIFIGNDVNPLTKPFPFFGYPFFAATLIGWAWTQLRKNSQSG